jgi:GT2 family glycosyltransferase
MDLSIIIVNYRGWKRLKECLDGLVSFTGRIPGIEVIIVDNNSSDSIIDEFKSNYPDFVFILNKVNGGFANGCNLGSARATGDYFLFLNPDTVATEGEVKRLLERAEKYPENYITSCRQINENGKESKVIGLFPGFGTLTGPGRAIYKVLYSKKVAGKTAEKDNLINPDWVSGSVMMIKKEIFLKIGGFDEDFWMYFEDMDICRRAWYMKGKIACFTDITIQHNHGGSSRINLKTTSLTKTEVFISNHLYISKHKTGLSRVLLQGYLVLYNLLTGLPEALIGLLFFASAKMFSRAIIYGRLVCYYFGAIVKGSWISPRSVKYNKGNL